MRRSATKVSDGRYVCRPRTLHLHRCGAAVAPFGALPSARHLRKSTNRFLNCINFYRLGHGSPMQMGGPFLFLRVCFLSTYLSDELVVLAYGGYPLTDTMNPEPNPFRFARSPSPSAGRTRDCRSTATC